MLPFVDYIQHAFYSRTKWDRDNAYTSLTATSQALLDFPIPTSLHLTCSSLPTPNFATSYTLNTLGLISGSVSYLYSSTPLALASINASTLSPASINDSALPPKNHSNGGSDGGTNTSSTLPLRSIVPSYRHLLPLYVPRPAYESEIWHRGVRIDKKDTLLFGRIYLPSRFLEALYLRRLGPTTLLRVAAVSTDQDASSGGGAAATVAGSGSGSVLISWAKDVGKWGVEVMGSSDSGLLGVRGLWNFGEDPRGGEKGGKMTEKMLATSTEAADAYIVEEPLHLDTMPENGRPKEPPSRLSAGFEMYYSPLNKTGGLSTGMRFTTLTTPVSGTSPLDPSPGLSASAPSSEASNSLDPYLLTSPTPRPRTSSSSPSPPPPPPPPPFPYTLTVTLSPLVGTLSTTYSLLATSRLALSSRFDFNVYSYESEFVVGAEMWRPKGSAVSKSKGVEDEGDDDTRNQQQMNGEREGGDFVREDLKWAVEKASRWHAPPPSSSTSTSSPSPPSPSPSTSSAPSTSSSPSSPSPTSQSPSSSPTPETGVLKLRASTTGGVRLLWISRFSSIIYSVGVQLGWDDDDATRFGGSAGRRKGVRGFGVEVGYVS